MLDLSSNKNRSVTSRSDPEYSYQLEGHRTSLGGYEFEPTSPTWLLAKGVTIDVQALREKTTEQLTTGVINTLVYYAERKAARSVQNICYLFYEYLHFAKPHGRLSEFQADEMLNYRAMRREQDGHDGRLLKIRPFFRTWHKLGHPGISDGILELINSMSLRQPIRGKAILQLDSVDGPLEPAESAALKAGVLSAYEHSTISHEQMLAALLLSYTGRRPIQIAHLKLKDLDDRRYDDLDAKDLGRTPRKLLLLHIPRAKQGASTFREYFRSIEVLPALWAALVRQRGEVANHFEEMLQEHGWEIEKLSFQEIVQELAMFPSWSSIEKTLRTLSTSQDSRNEKRIALQEIAVSEWWHRSPSKISTLVTEVSKTAAVIASSGQPLIATPRRLRYTKGTDTARAGYGKQVIAEVLDHTTTSSVDVYTQTLPEHARPINKAMALAMAPLVQLFKGRLVDHESDARGGNSPSVTRVLYRGEGTATCGTRIRCGLAQLPRPCYTCDSFQPWLDGPHEALLEELLRERQERLDVLGNSGMVEIADNTIIAVVNVIQQCESRRREISKAKHTENARTYSRSKRITPDKA